jgi:hypothetical protein
MIKWYKYKIWKKKELKKKRIKKFVIILIEMNKKKNEK